MNNGTRNILIGTAACAGAVAAYAFLIEPNWVETTHPRIHIRKLPGRLEGLKIGLVTDLHAGTGRSLSIIRRACRAAMREKDSEVTLVRSRQSFEGWFSLGVVVDTSDTQPNAVDRLHYGTIRKIFHPPCASYLPMPALDSHIVVVIAGDGVHP